MVALLRLLSIAVLLLYGCGGGDDETASTDVTGPDPQHLAALIAGGVPEPAARFFASARVSTEKLSPHSIPVTTTYPNDATHVADITYVIGQQYTPSQAEIDLATQSGLPLYGVKRSNQLTEGRFQARVEFFVPYDAMTAEMRAALTADTAVAVSWRRAFVTQLGQPDAGTSTEGATVIVEQAVVEQTVNEVAETTLGEMVDHFAKEGVKGFDTNPVKTVFGAASALSDVGGAAIAAELFSKWLKELDALEQCAAHPTNPLAMTDPGYIERTLKALAEARMELKMNGAVRFLSAELDASMGLLGEAGPILSVLTKPGLTWADQTNERASAELMEQARKMVVPCGAPAWGGTASSVEHLPDTATTVDIQAEYELSFQPKAIQTSAVTEFELAAGSKARIRKTTTGRPCTTKYFVTVALNADNALLQVAGSNYQLHVGVVTKANLEFTDCAPPFGAPDPTVDVSAGFSVFGTIPQGSVTISGSEVQELTPGGANMTLQ